LVAEVDGQLTEKPDPQHLLVDAGYLDTLWRRWCPHDIQFLTDGRPVDSRRLGPDRACLHFARSSRRHAYRHEREQLMTVHNVVAPGSRRLAVTGMAPRALGGEIRPDRSVVLQERGDPR
jgi:hypothetical protein